MTKDEILKFDPAMKQTRKGRNCHFGMKLHTGADQRGIVHTVRATVASTADIAQRLICCTGKERGCSAIKRTERRKIEVSPGMGTALPRSAGRPPPSGP
jgi:hypothetical protein